MLCMMVTILLVYSHTRNKSCDIDNLWMISSKGIMRIPVSCTM